MENIITLSEKKLDTILEEFKRTFGIVDEKNVVSESDYEKTYPVNIYQQ